LKQLENLRQSINETDAALVELFIKRMGYVARVGEYKAERNLKIYDPEREKAIIERVAGSAEADFDIRYVEQFMENLMFLSRRYQGDIIGGKQEPVKMSAQTGSASAVGYQGVPGCYSYQTSLLYFGEEVDTVSCHSFRDVFDALAQGKIGYGVLPIENSTSGSINEVYDLLREYEFKIVGEKCLKVEHSLMGVKGAKLADIQEVYSHQQGLLQCSRYLSEHPEWRQVPYFDTAGSAEHIAGESCRTKACIAGKMAASVYGLDILREDIQDNSNNSTRFVVIAREPLQAEKADKISIIISVPDKPGTLYGVLKHFAEGNCNLMKLESRPLEGKPWEYFFYIDLRGNLEETEMRGIMAEVEKQSSYFRILGNYRSEAGCSL